MFRCVCARIAYQAGQERLGVAELFGEARPDWAEGTKSRYDGVKPEVKSGHSWLVEYHHLGDEGLDVSDVRQTASCSERAKVFFGVAPIIRLVIILRKEF